VRTKTLLRVTPQEQLRTALQAAKQNDAGYFNAAHLLARRRRITTSAARRRLRSASSSSLVGRRTRLSTIADRAFVVAASFLSPPRLIPGCGTQNVTYRPVPSLPSFWKCQCLKSHLFRRPFNICSACAATSSF